MNGDTNNRAHGGGTFQMQSEENNPNVLIDVTSTINAADQLPADIGDQPIDYYADFEFVHRESPTPSENDIISHERLPSSDSFKEEEVLKPLVEFSKMNYGENFLKHDTGLY